MDRFTYYYDGTFGGFLCCIRDIYQYHEPPALFLPLDSDRTTFYPARFVETDQDLAKRVYARLGKRLGPKGLRFISLGFLTCLDQRERRLYEVIDFGLKVGPDLVKRLDHEQILQVGKAVRHLQREAELLTGFVRFSDHNGLLIGEITPKNQVLPLLRVHFRDRFAGETFALFDKTHSQLLLHKPGYSVIIPAENFTIPPPDAQEQIYRDLWRKFYDVLSIQSRYNPKCRQTHMPKRYWENMTEMRPDPPAPPIPHGELPPTQAKATFA